MLQYVSSSRNLLIEEVKTNVFPVRGANNPFLISSCTNFMMTTDFFTSCALTGFKVPFHKAKLHRGKDFDHISALCACQNRQFGTLMRCCEAWKHIEYCFFECIDFERICHIFGILTREKLVTTEVLFFKVNTTVTSNQMYYNSIIKQKITVNANKKQGLSEGVRKGFKPKGVWFKPPSKPPFKYADEPTRLWFKFV